MQIKMTIQSYDNPPAREKYIVPDGSWVQSKLTGAQYAYPVLKAEITNANAKAVVMCEPVGKIPDIPKELLKLVKERDKEWGKNGWQYMGKNRDRQGGTDLDRIRELAIWGKLTDGNCPVQVDKNKEAILKRL